MAKSKIEKVISSSTGNANGGYCKMPDGTLIQWGKKSVARNAGQNTATDNFYVPFVSTPIAVCSYMTGHPEIWMSAIYDITTTYLTVVLYNTGGTASGNGSVFWIAVGRWK